MTLGLGIVYVAAALIFAGIKDRSFTGILLGRDQAGSGETIDGGGTSPFSTGATGASSTSPLTASGAAGGFLPQGSAYKPGRIDHGRDFTTTPGGPIIAPGSGRVVKVSSDPSGFGPSYPVVSFSSGPYAGRTLYLGHTNAALKSGASFVQGQVLALTDTLKGIGSAKTPGWVEIGYGTPGGAGYGYGNPPF